MEPTRDFASPWHRSSYDRFVRHALPELLSAAVDLSAYQARYESPSELEVRFRVAGASAEAEIVFPGLPAPDRHDPEGAQTTAQATSTRTTTSAKGKVGGLEIARYFTTPGRHPYDGVEW